MKDQRTGRGLLVAVRADEDRPAQMTHALPAGILGLPLTKTPQELAAIYTAAKTEVMVEVFLDKLKLAEHVDITDPQTTAGLQALAASGLLTEIRVQEVLR